MIDPNQWVPHALDCLKEEFGPRLLYLGLQGSYQRGEATEKSDIDLVTLFDTLSLDDLDRYRDVVGGLPEGAKACGFACGAAEFARWPRHELFAFKMDTTDYHGRLEDFMPQVTREDTARGVAVSASALLHALTHTWLYAAPADFMAAVLPGAYKSAFFTMRVSVYLQTGHYHATKKSLLESLSGRDREIILAGQDFAAWSASRSAGFAFELLINWCRELLGSSGEK